MKNKAYIKYFIIFSIVLIGLLPTYNFYLYAKNYDYKKLFNTDSIEKYVNYGVYILLDRSMNQEQVITGKDGFLFLGNQYNNILHKTNGVYRPTNEEINSWTNKLKDLQKWYEDRGIKFIIVIAPNKHSIYKEKLPNWMQYDGKTITDDIVEYANLKNINILDLRSVLISQKNENYLLYTKHETHWNNIGAGIAYSQTIDFLNKKYNIKLNKIKFTTTEYSRNKSPLGNFMKIGDLIKVEDDTYRYSDINMSNILVKDIQKDTLKIMNNSVKNIVNTNVYTNDQAKAIFNARSKNNAQLLFLCDSFSATGDFIIGNSILYNETFSKTYKFHYNHICKVL
ncbi:hypothetical protein CCAL13119_05625 [Campylobacter sp. RM13119]|uniref:alginate O-acetyltransferase AlgX-related protein n=1 Tax=Campylobacter californiensis TaxID=1032243 RepID=UPI001475A298|nr:hypothetical protein [Campylobacter sp. RM13119]MBE3606440.1 hypothetical protein [Campylobacter sp. RM13119]